MNGNTQSHELRTEFENIAAQLDDDEDYVEIGEELYNQIKSEGELILAGTKDIDPVTYRVYEIERNLYVSIRTESRINSLRVVVDGIGNIEVDGVDMNKHRFRKEHERVTGEKPEDEVVETVNEWYREACVVTFDYSVMEGGKAPYDGDIAYMYAEEPLAGFNHVDLNDWEDYTHAARMAFRQKPNVLNANTQDFAVEVSFDPSVLLE